MAVASPGVTLVQQRDAAATVVGSANPTAPTAGTTILTLTAPAAGNWELVTYVILTTAAGAIDANNISVTVGGVAVVNVPVLPTTNLFAPTAPMTFNLTQGATVTLKAVASATATSVYNVTAVLRQIS